MKDVFTAGLHQLTIKIVWTSAMLKISAKPKAIKENGTRPSANLTSKVELIQLMNSAPISFKLFSMIQRSKEFLTLPVCKIFRKT